jgi:indolepyruvate decarboxylase
MPSRASHPANPQQVLLPNQRLLSKDPNITHNEVARWRYTELLHALGCNGWFAARVTTCGEFDQAAELQRQRGAGQCW